MGRKPRSTSKDEGVRSGDIPRVRLEELYAPRNDYERELFPNLGYARIIGTNPYCKPYHGQVGVIVRKDKEHGYMPWTSAVRIVFPSFWTHDGSEPDEERLNDAGYFRPEEWEEVFPDG